MTNCPNCGSPIEPYKCKCDYCGTWYFDMSTIDFTDEKPCYIKMKTFINGQKCYLTSLVTPRFEGITVESNTCDIVNKTGSVVNRYATKKTGKIDISFEMNMDFTNKTLAVIEVENGNESK